MQQGALGVSTSLQYVPGRFASTDEIVELAKVAQQYGGIYISHQRSESGADHAVARRSVRGRRARQHSRGGVAPQDRLQGELGTHARGVEALRGRARARPRRHRQHVSLRSRLERPRRVPAAVGARRRPRADAAAPRAIRRCAIASSATWTIPTPRTGRTSGTAPAAAPA